MSQSMHSPDPGGRKWQEPHFSRPLSGGGVKEILLVEDDAADALLVRRALRDWQGEFRLSWVDHLAGAVSRLEEEPIDGVLLDLALPDGAGLDNISRLRSVRPDLPVVVLTGNTDEALALQAIGWGAQDYLLKNQMVGELIARSIRYAIERKRMEEERLRLERKVREAQKLESLAVIAGGAAHDFNNLLTVILGNLHLARGHCPPGSPAHVHLDHMETAATRAAELCRQMLAYAGKGQFVTQQIDLSALVAESAGLIRSVLPKHVALDLDLARPLPPVLVDATQIRQVLFNLVINAAEAVGEADGTVRVHTGTLHAGPEYLAEAVVAPGGGAGEYVFAEVSDTGCGMSAEVRARIFDPFFTTKFMGRGLGLAAVLGIVRSHNGALRVTSAPGKGSTFHLLLPTHGAAPPASAEAVPAGQSQRVILVVEEESVRGVLATALEAQGFRALQIGAGAAARSHYQQHAAEVSLVILGLPLSETDAEAAFADVRSAMPDVPVLLACDGGEEWLAEHFHDRPGTALLPKPFTLPELTEKVRAALALRSEAHP